MQGGYAKALIAKVWEVYQEYTAIQLSNMTHQSGTPWDQIYRQFDGSIPNAVAIPDDSIKAYFKRSAAA